jgi:hypothetical protein
MDMTADYLLGRRFEFTDGKGPDVTCTGVDPEKQRVRLHALDGGKHWIPFLDVQVALITGVLQESETGVPFVND